MALNLFSHERAITQHMSRRREQVRTSPCLYGVVCYCTRVDILAANKTLITLFLPQIMSDYLARFRVAFTQTIRFEDAQQRLHVGEPNIKIKRMVKGEKVSTTSLQLHRSVGGECPFRQNDTEGSTSDPNTIRGIQRLHQWQSNANQSRDHARW